MKIRPISKVQRGASETEAAARSPGIRTIEALLAVGPAIGSRLYARAAKKNLRPFPFRVSGHMQLRPEFPFDRIHHLILRSPYLGEGTVKKCQKSLERSLKFFFSQV